MTLKELSQLYWLNREIEQDRERLRELESRAYSVGAAKAGSSPQSSETSRKAERYALELAGIRETIRAKQERCLDERRRLETYIAGIDDSMIRQIYTLRFISGLPWAQVAASLGGGNTADGVRMICKRYLREHP